MRAALVGLVLLCAANAAAAPARPDDGRVHVAGERVELAIGLDGADPAEWRACHPSCAGASGTSVRLVGAGEAPAVRLALRGGAAPIDLRALRFAADPGASAGSARFSADLPAEGVRIARSFEVSRDGYQVTMTVSALGPNAAAFMATRAFALEIDTPSGLEPPPGAGFAAMLEGVDAVIVGAGVRAIQPRGPVPVDPGDWTGAAGRFWTILARSDDCGGAVQARPGAGVALSPREGRHPLACRYVLYAGPIESRALAAADPRLERLLFSGLWSGLRPLSFALLGLLRALTELVGHPGPAIVLLAVSVKILLLPLTMVADRLQQQVNAAQARLEPGLAAIRATSRGEERTWRTVALYREQGVHPLYALKSLAGFLIQLPVFVAVFDMLAGDFDLQRVSLLWIRDLARPDALLALPFCLPFFGCELNALPFLMSGVSLATVLRHRTHGLTPELARRQRRNLTGVTALFFLLFYTFPAAMVLYWTSTNAVQLVSEQVARRKLSPLGQVSREP